MFTCRASVEAGLRRLGAIGPTHAPDISVPRRRSAARRQSVDDSPFQPELGRVVTPLAGLVSIKIVGHRQQIAVPVRFRQRRAQLRDDAVTFAFDGVGVLKALYEQLVEHRLHFRRVHDIGCLVHAELLSDDGELFFQHLPNAVLHRVFQHEVESTNHVLLADTIHATDPLLDPHRVPRHVEVDDDVAELKVQTFATCIRRNQHARVLGECLQGSRAGIHIHAPVECGDRKSSAFQIFREHGLCGHELGEHQHFQRRIALFLLQLVNQFEQALRLCVCACCLRGARQREQSFDLRLLQL